MTQRRSSRSSPRSSARRCAPARAPPTRHLSSNPVPLRVALRELPPAAWILFAGSFVNRFGSFVAVFLVLWLTREGYSVGEAGAAVSLYGVGGIGAAVGGGWLADRIGRRETIAVSMFGAAAALLALSQARSLHLVLVLVVIVGFTAELYRPASSALVADLVPAGRRVPAYAAYRLAINAGFAAGPAVGGLLAERSFLWLFVGDAVTCAGFGVVALLFLPRRVQSAHPAARRPRFELLRALRRDRAFLAYLVASMLAAVVYFQQFTTLPLHVRSTGLGLAVFGALLSLNGLAILLFELPLTSITARLPVRPTIAAGYLLSGIGFALTGLAGSVVVFGLTVLVWTLGEMVAAPVSSAYVADLAPPHLRGRYQGAHGLTFSLAFVIAPLLGSAVYGWRPGVLWMLCLALGTAAALLVLVSGGPPSDRADTVDPWTPSQD